MTIGEFLKDNTQLRFSFGKSNGYHMTFSQAMRCLSMYDEGFGLGISSSLSAENQLRGIFQTITKHDGLFLFNLNGVDLLRARTGFENYSEAEASNWITEWELSQILANTDYRKRTVFHNGKVIFKLLKDALWIRLN